MQPSAKPKEFTVQPIQAIDIVSKLTKRYPVDEKSKLTMVYANGCTHSNHLSCCVMSHS